MDAKRAEVAALQKRAAALRAAAESATAVPSFEAALRGGSSVAVIAEVKRRSPSAGAIVADASAAEVAVAYEAAGVAAVSVLTDEAYFGGSLADLESVRGRVGLPLLRKDFTMDPVQIWEARAAGASAVLLIVRILTDAQLRDYRELAEELGLSALVEVHDEGELERALAAGARVVGVNNRDLATFETDLRTTVRLAPGVPPDVVLVGESGIGSASDVALLAGAGVHAVLVGEALMRAPSPSELARQLASVPRAA